MIDQSVDSFDHAGASERWLADCGANKQLESIEFSCIDVDYVKET